MYKQSRLDLLKTLYNLKKPIQVISDNLFYGYTYEQAILYIGKDRAKEIYKVHQSRMRAYKKADLNRIGLHPVESKKSGDKLYLLVNDMGYYIFDVDLKVLGTDPHYVKPRIIGEGEWDRIWEVIIRNEARVNEFTDIPIKVSFTNEYGIYKEGILYEFIEVMGCIAYGSILSDEITYNIPIFFLDIST